MCLQSFCTEALKSPLKEPRRNPSNAISSPPEDWFGKLKASGLQLDQAHLSTSSRFVDRSVDRAICLSVWLAVCLSIHLSVCPSVSTGYLSVYPSVCLYMYAVYACILSMCMRLYM